MFYFIHLSILIVKCDILRITQGWRWLRNILEIPIYPAARYRINGNGSEISYDFCEPVPIYPGSEIFYNTGNELHDILGAFYNGLGICGTAPYSLPQGLVMFALLQYVPWCSPVHHCKRTFVSE